MERHDRPGRPLDTDRFFVVCANVLGGCQGTTGPSSPHPDDGLPWGSRFPVITIRDIVRSQALLANDLGIGRWAAVVGGSMGGMQALEWAVMYPERVGALVSIASAAAASPLQIGWSEVGRLAIAQDPLAAGRLLRRRTRRRSGRGVDAGAARRTAALPIRRLARAALRPSRGRQTRPVRHVGPIPDRGLSRLPRSETGSTVRRNSYLLLNKAMDLHDIGRDRGGLDLAAARVQCPTLVVSIDSDVLYTPRQQLELADILRRGNAPLVEFATLESIHGHDGFLIEFPQLGPIVERFVDEQAKA
ncbi:MAG: alpha/beta fold hydrolase [Acidimicrobiales bacterium]